VNTPSKKQANTTERAASAAQQAELKKRLLKRYERLLDQALANHPEGRRLSIDEIEKLACDVREQVGEEFANEVTAEEARAATEAEEGQKNTCKRCERPAQYRGSQERSITTTAGVVTVRRRVYYCRICDCCTMPVDDDLRLPKHGCTAHVERMVAKECTDDAFELGVNRIRELAGVYVSTAEAKRITLAVGEFAQKAMQTDAAKAARDPESVARQVHSRRVTVYLFLDGIHTPLVGGWRESKVGCLCIVEGDGRRRTYYTHHLGGPYNIGKQIYALAARAGVAESARVVAIGDGAPWIWRQIKLRFPEATQILDWYHATEHLSEVAKVCMQVETLTECGEAGIAANQWYEDAKAAMWEGRIAEVIHRVKQLPSTNQKAAEAKRITAAYFAKNEHRMHYEQYRERGYCIGSGQIESGCKQVIGKRMKGAGMRWREPMAKAMGALRALRLSFRRWDEVVGAWPGRDMIPVPTF
jgi:hypothetical protein